MALTPNTKQSPIPVVPRTMKLVNPDGTVTRSGQLLLEQTQAPSATQGTHASRPDPKQVPDGALYTESDRTVLYYASGGEWHYLAGEMYGTLNPDQRPTDLGVNDAGFLFRATDNDPQYSGREGAWSGGEWIEITPALWGTHANRLALTVADQINGELYVEADRSGVIYQNQFGVWHFLAGTMWGTLTPDTRPTDLGTDDAGFTFRGTDQQRQFIWSGTAWVETTPVGTPSTLSHPNVVTKVGGTAGQIVEGGITDLSAGNSGKMTITAAGLVGIGTPIPAYSLQTVGSNTSKYLAFDTAAGTATGPAANGSYAFLRFGGPNGNGPVIYSSMDAGTYQSVRLEIQTLNGSGTLIDTMALENGSVGIGVTAPSYLLQLASDSAGKPGTSTWAIVSDSRVKRNVTDLTGGLDVIERLRPVEAEYNGLHGTPEGQRVLSFVAEEIREVLPGTVKSHRGKLRETDEEETDILDFNIHEVLMHLVLAVKQLGAEVETLKRPLM
jgi:hypothetical protein